MCAVGGGGERGGAWASQHTHFHECVAVWWCVFVCK